MEGNGEILSNAERDEKWEAVTGRLKKREDERLDRVRRNKELGEDNRDESTRAQQFLAEFELRRQALLASLEPPDVTDASRTTNTDDQCLEHGAQELRTLSALAGEAQMFLSTYDRKSVNEALGILQERLTARQKDLVPRSRFAFKKRPAKKRLDEVDAKLPMPKIDVMPATVVEPEHRKEEPIECGFSDRSSAQLSLDAEQVDGRDVELRRLTGCQVTVTGNPGTVHATACVDCRVVLGPVTTSVFVDNCRDSDFRLACQQLRVHRSTDCHFRVQVASRSIVEDCRRLGFGPLGPSYYAAMGEHFPRSGLVAGTEDSDLSANNWDRVDDFDWLVAGTPSPNWFRLTSDHTNGKPNGQ